MQRLALLGCGRVASHIAQFLEKGIHGVQVVSTCDLVKEKADAMAQRLGATAVYDLNEILQNPNVDVMLVLTESGKHGVHAREALNAGKHVIVEKPIGLLPQEVKENIALAAQKKLMYAAIKQNRFNPAIAHLKQTVDSGRFGKQVLGSARVIWCRYQDYYEDGWHGTWKMDGGVISQQAIHHIDALQWICGPIKEVVSAQQNALNRLEAEDTTVALVRFEHGGLGTIEVTTAARPEDKEASLSIVGEHGSAQISGVALNTIVGWVFTHKQAGDEETPSTYSQAVPNGYGLSHGPLLQETFDRLNAGRIDPPVTPADALASVRIVHALYKSAEDHAWVPVNEQVRSARLGNPST
ncbi:Gfo/Idh/MocA family oxidoreductase [Candidatus Uhrbacteria bacterium]|nr:Gfo/Idh/MocA family oxidoreductase [Candidatus Uhrbacteria bacterium]